MLCRPLGNPVDSIEVEVGPRKHRTCKDILHGIKIGKALTVSIEPTDNFNISTNIYKIGLKFGLLFTPSSELYF